MFRIFFNRKSDSSDSNPNPLTNELREKARSKSITYKHPKIMLFDLKDDSENTLKSEGFNVEVGSFGSPFKVKTSDNYLPLDTNANLPNYQEQEIIIIDLTINDFTDKVSNRPIIEREGGFWGHLNLGFIDPRPITATIVKPDFDNILKHNGVFIIFADCESPCKIVWGTPEYDLNVKRSDYGIWSFLSTLETNQMSVLEKSGTEITTTIKNQSLKTLFDKYFAESNYTCILSPTNYVEGFYENKIIGYANRNADSWKVLATNKYDETVAAVFLPDSNYNGTIYILPQIKDKANFLLEFIRDFLPDAVPTLFPFSKKTSWIESDEYQSVNINNLKNQITEIQNEAEKETNKIRKKIEVEKDRSKYINTLLLEDDEVLVTAVEKTLNVLGFEKIFNVDEEYKKIKTIKTNDEDLQVRDKPASLIIEVKGVSGHPKDDDVFQIIKHIPIRMKEWKEFDVKALSIINHQKGIPALERENVKPFRDLILESAKEQNLGLMTTFDLYRLTRNFLKFGWKHENIKSLFYQSGHIPIVPTHYEYIGVIENYWEQVGVVGIRIEETPIELSDTISFELPIEFEEIKVNSLQVDNSVVEIANTGNLAGIKTTLSKDILKKGIRVFSHKM